MSRHLAGPPRAQLGADCFPARWPAAHDGVFRYAQASNPGGGDVPVGDTDPLAMSSHFLNQADPPHNSATRALHSRAALLSVLLLGLRHRRLLPVALGMGLHVALDAYHRAQMERARSAAMARDGYSCQVCGAVSVRAHVSRQPRLLPSYRAQNLISLCGRCHDAAHARLTGPASWI